MLMIAHSTIRYFVLVAGGLAILYCLVGLVARREFSPLATGLASAFAGLTHLQVVIGLILLFLRPFMPLLFGHLTLMLLAAATLQFTLSALKRRKPEERGYAPILVSCLIAFALIAGGVMAIGRGVLETTVL